MKFEDILLSLLLEQVNPPDWEDDQEEDPIDDEEPDEPTDDEEPSGDEEAGDDDEKKVKVPKVKPLKPIEVLINKWKAENPGIDDSEIRQMIEFFNARKDNLRPYMPPQEARLKNYRNMPEIVEFKRNFPAFPAENVARLRDIQNYTWGQLEFLSDRFNSSNARELVEFTIEGDTPERREESARRMWQRTSNRIIEKNGVTVYRVTGQDEAISLGNLQHILVGKFGGNFWCITNIGSVGGSYYESYRNRRAYYFILDRNKPEESPFYISVIQPIKHDSGYYWDSEGPFTLSLRPNQGDSTRKSWEDIVRIWPELNGEAERFKFFGKTQNEGGITEINRVNFRGDNEYDFERISNELKLRYVSDPHKTITKLKYFESLSDALLHTYIANTQLETYYVKYVSDNASNPYEILDYIESDRPAEYKFLNNVVLKTQLGIALGVGGMKLKMMGISYEYSYTDVNKNIKLLKDKFSDKFGIISLKTLQFLKGMTYIITKPRTLLKTSQDENGRTKRELYFMFRYTLSLTLGGDDYFYWLVPQTNISPESKHKSNYYKGTYYSKEDGDQLLNSDEYKKL